MRILTFTGYYLPGYKGGGPIKTVKNLFDQTSSSISYKLITSDRDLGDSVPYSSVVCGAWNEVDNAKVFYVQSGALGYKQIAIILLEKQYDIVYLNSFFSPRFSLFPMLIAKMLKQKVIVGPRGEFSKGALSLKAQKKQSFINLYKTLRLHQDTVFQASSKHEADDIRKALGHKVDIQIAEDIGAQEFVKTLPIRNINKFNIVFVSRISPMKNLLTALEILRTVKQVVNYGIYGPIEDEEYWEQCQKVIKDLPKNIQVEYKGELLPEEVIETIAKYDLFFMPTKGENYGHVIAEALCAGLPILIADTTPWRDLEAKGIGWDLPLDDLSAFRDVIEQLALESPNERYRMRKKVLKWARDKFSQRNAIDANIAMFQYVINK
jgi:glycosyltransferase involved in cell wall biosynthesis